MATHKVSAVSATINAADVPPALIVDWLKLQHVGAHEMARDYPGEPRYRERAAGLAAAIKLIQDQFEA